MRHLQNNTKYCQTNQTNTVPGQIFYPSTNTWTLSPPINQSGFKQQHSTGTASTKVLIDLVEALDAKDCCVAHFVHLSKVFDTIDRNLLYHRPFPTDQAIHWFSNDLSDRKQFVKLHDWSSCYLNVIKGVPQGSLLGPTLFVI